MSAKTKLSMLAVKPLARATRVMITRAGKGDELEWHELDGNFTSLDQDLAAAQALIAQLQLTSGVSSVNDKTGAVELTLDDLNAMRSHLSRTVEVINGVSYYQVTSAAPQETTAATAVNTQTQADVFNLIAQFVTRKQTEQVLINPGVWPLRLWLQASHANCRLVLQLSRLNTDTFTKTVLHNTMWPDIDPTQQAFVFNYAPPLPLLLETNERLLLEFICHSASPGRSLTLIFDAVDQPSRFDVPVALTHNSMPLQQGGKDGERWHFTKDQHDGVLEMLAHGAGRVRTYLFRQHDTFVKSPGAVYFNEGTGHSFQEVSWNDGAGVVYGMVFGDVDADKWPDIIAARSDAPNAIWFGKKLTPFRRSVRQPGHHLPKRLN